MGGRVGGRGGWEVGGGRVGGGRWEGYGNGQVRFDQFDRRSDSMPVFAVGLLGMFNLQKFPHISSYIPYSTSDFRKFSCGMRLPAVTAAMCRSC